MSTMQPQDDDQPAILIQAKPVSSFKKQYKLPNFGDDDLRISLASDEDVFSKKERACLPMIECSNRIRLD